MAITLEYILVIKPEFEEKLRLVKLGSKTFPKAMAMPRSRVPEKRSNIPSKVLIPMPMTRSSIAPSKVPPIPKRRVKMVVKEETIPKAIKGSVVNNPSMEFDRPVDALIWPTKGPRLASAGLKFMAIHKMPVINKILFHLDGFSLDCALAIGMKFC